jgi:hypothetical protein
VTVAPDRFVFGRFISALVWIAFIVIPRPSSGLVNGVPIGPVEAAALVAIGWLFVRRAHLSGAAAAGSALALSMALAWIVPDSGGFTARYFAGTDTSQAFERSTEFKGREFSRIDRTLTFEPVRAEFPLPFFNDLGRFNFYLPHQPNRESMAFAVLWDGNWLVETDGSAREIYLDAPFANAQVLLDGEPVVSVSPADDLRVATVSPARGWHRLHVRFVSFSGSPRRFSVGERQGPSRHPFDASSVFTTQSTPRQLSANPFVRRAMTAIDLLALGWLAFLLASGIRKTLTAIDGRRAWEPSRDLLALLVLVAAAEALVFALPWTWRTMILVGGDDTLTYEYYARQIQLDSFLLSHGGGEPFFYQVLYPYVLAGMHGVFGESMFGPMLVQRLLLALLVWAIVEIAVKVGGRAVWWCALACGTAFAYILMAPISAKLLNESLFVPLLAAWVAAILSISASPTWLGVIGAGLLGGVTTLTRSTALLGWAIVFPMCWWSWKAVPRRGLLVATMLICSCSVMSAIAIRNWVVVHELIFMPGELPVTLYGGNEPPASLSIDEERHRALYDRLGLHPFTRQVTEYALTAPGSFLRNLLNKALFALGYFDFYAPGWGYSIGLLMLSIASAAGVLLLVRHPAAPYWVVMLPALIALTQYAAVVIVYPKGMRLILPFHALMVPYAAVAVNAVWRRVRSPGP